MKLFYDVLVNVNEEMYSFYEWSRNDVIERLDIVPIMRVSGQVMESIFGNRIRVDRELIGKIKGRNSSNLILFTDIYSSLVLEFNDEGEEIGVSRLLLANEMDVMEVGFSLVEESIDIEVIEKRKERVLRQDEIIKRYLTVEFRGLYEGRSYEKLLYFYFERFGHDCKSVNVAYKELIDDLEVISKEHYRLYDLVMMTYKKSTGCALSA